MKDARIVLDNVRSQIPTGAKLLISYIDNNGVLRLSQANCTQTDVENIADSIKASCMTERMGLSG